MRPLPPEANSEMKVLYTMLGICFLAFFLLVPYVLDEKEILEKRLVESKQLVEELKKTTTSVPLAQGCSDSREVIPYDAGNTSRDNGESTPEEPTYLSLGSGEFVQLTARTKWFEEYRNLTLLRAINLYSGYDDKPLSAVDCEYLSFRLENNDRERRAAIDAGMAAETDDEANIIVGFENSRYDELLDLLFHQYFKDWPGIVEYRRSLLPSLLVGELDQ